MLPPVLTLPIHQLEVATAAPVATTVQGLIPIVIINAITTNAITTNAITAIIVTNIEIATSIETNIAISIATNIEINKKFSPSLAS